MARFRNLLGAVLLGAGALLSAAPARAAGEVPAFPDYRFTFDGLFGTFDRGQLQRGFQVYKEVCAACHAMRQLSYRNLLEIGLTEAQVRNIAAQFQVVDGPNDNGEMFERPARK